MVDAVCVLISCASRPETYDLANFIGRGEMLGARQPVIIHLFDVPDAKHSLELLANELIDSAMPSLERVYIVENANTMFDNVDIAIILDTLVFDDFFTKKDQISLCLSVYRHLGKALEQHGKQTVKVIVAGDPVNINTDILSRYAPSMSKSCFTGLLRMDQNRALYQLAKRLQIDIEMVKNVIIWGNAGPTEHVDMTHAQVVSKETGKSKSASELINNEHWMKHVFLPHVQKNCSRALSPHQVAMLKAKAIVDHVHDLWFGTSQSNWTSMVTYSNGEYGAPKDVYFGFPVTVPCYEKTHCAQIVPDLKFDDDWTTAQLQCTVDELSEVRQLIHEAIEEQSAAT